MPFRVFIIEQTLYIRQKCHEKEQCREKELNELNEKLRATEEREATLLVELFELREQNELLEFRLLELEETPTRKDSPDYSMDSGVVSPEPTHKVENLMKNILMKVLMINE